MPTPVPGAFTSSWILPRTNQVSPGHLIAPVCTLVPSFRILSHPLPIIKATPLGGFYYWQRMRDSNPRKRSQSPVCYRYTNPLSHGRILLYAERAKSQALFSKTSHIFSFGPSVVYPQKESLILPTGKVFPSAHDS